MPIDSGKGLLAAAVPEDSATAVVRDIRAGRMVAALSVIWGGCDGAQKCMPVDGFNWRYGRTVPSSEVHSGQ